MERAFFSITLRLGSWRFRWRARRRPFLSSSIFWTCLPLVLFASYVLGVIPIAILLEYTGVFSHPIVERIFLIVYAPIIWAYENIEWVENFYDAYQELMESLIDVQA